MLEVSDLSVSYGPIQAVRHVSFKVSAGDVVTLIGPNGAGKTSTLNAICGLVPVSSGTVHLGGQDISRRPSHERVARGLVQVPEGRLVLAGMSVRENLEMGAYRRASAEVAPRIAEMEERFPVLGQRRDAPAGALSGGEQQMLAIARALMARPKVLLLDEPSLGLAPLLVNRVFEIIRELQEDGQTILLVEQNARKSLAASSYGYVMESGSVVLEGPAEQLRSDPEVLRAYFGGAV